MTADELRSLAEQTDINGCHTAATYLRACASAMDAGPVAWGLKMPDGVRLIHATLQASINAKNRWADAYDDADHVPLYTLAMPEPKPALRLPEPMTDADLRDLLWSADWRMGPLQDFARAVEAETLRRVREANE